MQYKENIKGLSGERRSFFYIIGLGCQKTLFQYNTHLGVILVDVFCINLPLSIFLMRGFISTVPKELEEAALIDGCGTFQCFWRIIFPLLSRVVKSDDMEGAKKVLDPNAVKGYCYPENFQRLARAEKIAKERGLTITQVALAWILNQDIDVFPLVSVPGGELMQSNIQALDISLSEDEVKWLDLRVNIFRKLRFMHSFIIIGKKTDISHKALNRQTRYNMIKI